jgi:hypothetical protein
MSHQLLSHEMMLVNSIEVTKPVKPYSSIRLIGFQCYVKGINNQLLSHEMMLVNSIEVTKPV